MAAKFYAKFSENYSEWLAAVKIIAQLDCLISLAKASASIGQPGCRPVFSNSERTVVEFEDLRHPCMLNTVDDFIPNDIKLGGDSANIDLLTGANAAGKSTILRMVRKVSPLTPLKFTDVVIDMHCCHSCPGWMLRALHLSHTDSHRPDHVSSGCQ